MHVGATPRFADIDPQTYNMDPRSAEKLITDRTGAIVVVHHAGVPADIEAFLELGRRRGIPIIEDCAHAPGALYRGAHGPRPAGTWGDIGCFSFFANKNLTTGEGGMVITDDDELARKIKTARSHGMTSLTWDRHQGHASSYDVVARGYNYRLDEMRAALGLIQLSRLAPGNARRRELTRAYQPRLSGLAGLKLPFLNAPEGSAHHLFPVLLAEPAARADFMATLARQGIQTSIHYPPVHLFSYYRGLWPPGYDHQLPLTEDVAARLVTLPLYPGLHLSQIDLVCAAIHAFFA